jgi:hypothetical protein
MCCMSLAVLEFGRPTTRSFVMLVMFLGWRIVCTIRNRMGITHTKLH